MVTIFANPELNADHRGRDPDGPAPRADPDGPFQASGSGLRSDGQPLVGPRVEDADFRPIALGQLFDRRPRGVVLLGPPAQGA